MSSVASVKIHASQFPDAVRRDFLESLCSRRIHHKFHYDSVKQTQKWLALHQVYSPSRKDPECAAAYQAAFAAAIAECRSQQVHVVGLGCGGGQKDTQLLRQLAASGKQVTYTPCDVSTAMVLVARSNALGVLSQENCFPLVCDLLAAGDLPALIESNCPAGSARLITFFGMIPNFEPDRIMPALVGVLRAGDVLLFSANLVAGVDYTAGLQRILPQYDNELTRDWLMIFLLDLGVERGDGELRFSVHEFPSGSGLKRVEAEFHFAITRSLRIEGEEFEFRSGDSIRLFFSYRYTPELVAKLLARYGLDVFSEWITTSGEEGVFICRRR